MQSLWDVKVTVSSLSTAKRGLFFKATSLFTLQEGRKKNVLNHGKLEYTVSQS